MCDACVCVLYTMLYVCVCVCVCLFVICVSDETASPRISLLVMVTMGHFIERTTHLVTYIASHSVGPSHRIVNMQPHTNDGFAILDSVRSRLHSALDSSYSVLIDCWRIELSHRSAFDALAEEALIHGPCSWLVYCLNKQHHRLREANDNRKWAEVLYTELETEWWIEESSWRDEVYYGVFQ